MKRSSPQTIKRVRENYLGLQWILSTNHPKIREFENQVLTHFTNDEVEKILCWCQDYIIQERSDRNIYNGSE